MPGCWCRMPTRFFCSNFVKLLIKLKTPGFHLLDFYNSWTIMLTQCLKSCSEREAKVFGVFLREMMQYVLYLRQDEKTFLAEMKDNPAFYRNYRDEPSKTTKDSPIEWTNFADIKRGHSKWEGRIYKVMRQGLEADDWMEKRNALLLLSQAYEAFPVVERYASLVLQAVVGMQEREDSGDLKTLAASLTVKLRAQQERWVDKSAAPTTQSSRKAEDAPAAPHRDAASASGAKDTPAGAHGDAAGANGAKVDLRDRDRDRQRDRDRDRHSERPSTANGGASGPSSGGAPAPAAAAAEKRPVAEKDASGDKRVHREEEEAREGDRKRSANSMAAPQSSARSHAASGGGDRRGDAGPPQHDDRVAEKRRRADRDGDVPAHRGTSSTTGHSRGDAREADRKHSVSSAPPPQSGGTQHVASGGSDRRGDVGPPPHDDRTTEKRRRAERDGEGTGHRGTSSSAAHSNRGDTREADRKRTASGVAPPQGSATLHGASGGTDRRSDVGPPQHDERAEKRRRAERDGETSGHRGSSGNAPHSSRGVEGHRSSGGSAAGKRRHGSASAR